MGVPFTPDPPPPEGGPPAGQHSFIDFAGYAVGYPAQVAIPPTGTSYAAGKRRITRWLLARAMEEELERQLSRGVVLPEILKRAERLSNMADEIERRQKMLTSVWSVVLSEI